MSSNKQVITIRVSKEVKELFEKACMEERRSMSKQGELLFEEYLRARYVVIDEANDWDGSVWEEIQKINDKTR